MGFNIANSTCIDNTACPFSIANGSCLTAIGIIGFLMSSFTFYCLIFHVKLPYCQNISILNISTSDILLSLAGIVRGLGILDVKYVGVTDTGQCNLWSHLYTIAANSIWMLPIPVLVPLTFDRFVAITFPFRHRTIVNKFTVKIVVALAWIPVLILLLYDCITFADGTTIIKYQKNYHRCVIQNSKAWRSFVFNYVPFSAIILMYIIMCFHLRKLGLETKKMLLMSTAIIATGLITLIPDTLLLAFNVRMSYEVAQITTVTLYYTNSIWNPLIYFYTNRHTLKDLADTEVGKRISVALESKSKTSNVINTGVTANRDTVNTTNRDLVLVPPGEIVLLPEIVLSAIPRAPRDSV